MEPYPVRQPGSCFYQTDVVLLVSMKKEHAPDTEGQRRAVFSPSSTVVSEIRKLLNLSKNVL